LYNHCFDGLQLCSAWTDHVPCISSQWAGFPSFSLWWDECCRQRVPALNGIGTTVETWCYAYTRRTDSYGRGNAGGIRIGRNSKH
jgi:hypothetical protein